MCIIFITALGQIPKNRNFENYLILVLPCTKGTKESRNKGDKQREKEIKNRRTERRQKIRRDGERGCKREEEKRKEGARVLGSEEADLEMGLAGIAPIFFRSGFAWSRWFISLRRWHCSHPPIGEHTLPIVSPRTSTRWWNDEENPKWGNLDNSAQSEKKPDTNGHILSEPLIQSTQKRQLHRDRKWISGCQGLDGDDHLIGMKFPFGEQKIY